MAKKLGICSSAEQRSDRNFWRKNREEGIVGKCVAVAKVKLESEASPLLVPLC